MFDIEKYKAACVFPGEIDDSAVKIALAGYCAALKIEREIVRIERGWKLSDYPDLQRTIVEIARAARDARDARDALAASDARAALAARDASDASAASDARDALAASDARATRDARDARDALAASDARDASAALHRFAKWCIARQYWWDWDLSLISEINAGAHQIKENRVIAWSDPIYDAFLSGASFLFWTDKTLYWVAKPDIKTEIVNGSRRLHCEDGPAADFDSEPLYFWHGNLVPKHWIEAKNDLTADEIFKEDNAEIRRAGCEIIGWDRVLSGIDAKIVDTDGDPMIGTLYRGQIPGAVECGFLKVLCGTGREFVIPVSPEINTAIKAQAWVQNVSFEKWMRPEVRG